MAKENKIRICINGNAGNSVESPTMLKNTGGRTSGRDFTFKIFEISG